MVGSTSILMGDVGFARVEMFQDQEDTISSGAQQELQLESDNLGNEDPSNLKNSQHIRKISADCLCGKNVSSANLPTATANSVSTHLESVTEGQAMDYLVSNSSKHQQNESVFHTSNTSDSSNSSHSSSQSIQANKSTSETGTWTSLSSSPSNGLHMVLRSHRSRRRSSTLSQSSSVLSERTRHQLNFDLSPDLPPDSSILDANEIMANFGDEADPELQECCYRPPTPEPVSFDTLSEERGSSTLDSSEELRPISRMSIGGPFCFEDDDLEFSNGVSSPISSSNTRLCTTNGNCDSSFGQMKSVEPSKGFNDETTTRKSNKRAHTPHDPIVQRNKVPVGLFNQVACQQIEHHQQQQQQEQLLS